MEKAPQEMSKAHVESQKLSSTTEIMTAMKEMFLDVLEQVVESELDTELGCEKIKGHQILLSKTRAGITGTDTQKRPSKHH